MLSSLWQPVFEQGGGWEDQKAGFRGDNLCSSLFEISQAIKYQLPHLPPSLIGETIACRKLRAGWNKEPQACAPDQREQGLVCPICH